MMVYACPFFSLTNLPNYNTVPDLPFLCALGTFRHAMLRYLRRPAAVHCSPPGYLGDVSHDLFELLPVVDFSLFLHRTVIWLSLALV